MPVYFIPNRGQMDEPVAYYVQGQDKSIFFTAEGITFSLVRPEKKEDDSGPFRPAIKEAGAALKKDSSPGLPEAHEDGRSERWVVKLDFVGANRDVQPLGEAETGAVISYFSGKKEDWKTGLPTYSKIIYPDLWPGIDLVYFGTVNRLKYEFIVHPGADPEKIRFSYRGAESVSIDDRGRLQVQTPAGDLSDDVPLAYQDVGTERTGVPIAYVLEPAEGTDEKPAPARQGLTKDWIYTFKVGDYDRQLPLVLDPAILAYCGFVAGSGNDYGLGIAVDESGNAYLTGSTNSHDVNFPETVGPDLTFNGGSADAFVAKVNAAGTALVYCGYIGGGTSDQAWAVAVDGSGNAYVSGWTDGSQVFFPVTVGPDLTHNGDVDIFVAKVNPSGTALDYCGYIGGSAGDYGYGIAVDGLGSAYVTGWTYSNEATFPAAVGPDLTYNGASDAFVAKVNAAGTALEYCGYIGGSSTDPGYSIAVDGLGSAYVTGYTYSNEATFPTAVGPDLTHNGYYDAFIAKVNSAGTALAYCGFIGGSLYDYGYSVAVDWQGHAYLTGETSSPEASFPETVGPDLTHNGNNDAFVAKVDAAGTALVYCGYLGGSASDKGRGIAVDWSGNAYVTGIAESTEASFPEAVGPDLTHNGVGDAFVAKLNASGTAFLYCGYIGGAAEEWGLEIAADGWGNAYEIGYTSSSEATFPETVGPDLTYNGFVDAFAAKIYHFEPPLSKHSVGDFDGDGRDEVAMDFGASGAWMWDNGVWTQLTNINPENLTAADVDGDNDEEILLDLGASGLWLWNGGAWIQVSNVNVDTVAAGDIDGDGSDEAAADFGASGLWLWDDGQWTQISGADLEHLSLANLDGNGGTEVIGDFGSLGLWVWSAGLWTQLSGVNADSLNTGDTDGMGGQDLIGDFGPLGQWVYSGGAWAQLSGINADSALMADIDDSGDDELVGDFALAGFWIWDSGAWLQPSGVICEDMVAANIDADGAEEIAVDFVLLGLWLWNGGEWNQLSGVNPEGLLAGEIDGDIAEELVVDFGSAGVWIWDSGAWTKISALNPD